MSEQVMQMKEKPESPASEPTEDISLDEPSSSKSKWWIYLILILIGLIIGFILGKWVI